ncbi:tripartite tricarboxylate transporter substrate binding protein [Variovorax ginsengisoli]|jgi:tripartite-type tricarboxylate transporter receptor subunit TctC|uniref:Tripartite tricarboxylate transporter substrate binding protein n=1 Tax=Variovorax ginsengisoli TaxID=363844 RepID=A0ABT8SCW8_9BURK|nr:tripartite tricarboxylate transporter substrate binding protein [Variovorax ginsengisoli]MDN8617588.1 tripartite tricarboxylate transporter substrate binding protein [Variovorax ginsengisoli]MDO1536758.1 tripartite tricarboxylate transporter substrate binding protein [Variovorax ginsengisoli]HET7835663.1 tripartite tricarboxylate transporter substrate binding protein [Variovorax sp.]
MKRRDILIASVTALAGTARAQIGNTPIRLLVGAPAGGSTDTIARTLAAGMGPVLGRTVIVENRPGAGGNIAAEVVAKAPPDGNTLLLSFTSHAINATLYPTLPFDPVKDFTALSCIATSPSILVAHPSVPADNVRELIALAKAKPGQLNFAIGALGSSLHMAGEAFKMQSGVYIVNIPYRGTAPAVQDVLAGQVQLMFAAVGNVQQHIKAGKLKALGVTSAKRLPEFPDLPAIAETLPGYESSAWFGLFGPARMPAETTRRLADAARQAIAEPAMRKRFDSEGVIAVGNTPEQFGPFVQSEIKRWAQVVKYSGARPE